LDIQPSLDQSIYTPGNISIPGLAKER